jgi:RNA polymerase-interacting CarD/CdnL/TRCF family regulator
MFKVGDEVYYGIHGRCEVTAIETKNVGGQAVSFYAIRAIRAVPLPKAMSRSQAQILVPTANTDKTGLRSAMSAELAAQVLVMLADQEYYYPLQENWVMKNRHLEDVIRREGALGLAKAVGHLHVLVKRDVAPRGDAIRLHESLMRALVNELALALDKAPKDVELTVLRALKNKLNADQ